MEIVLLSLLGLGAAAALVIELFNDDDEADAPSTPGGEDPTDAPTDGSDLLNGTGDADRITAGTGDDTVNGLGGNDTLLGEVGDDLLDGGDGDDSLDGSDGSDTLIGGAGNDVTFGRLGNDLQQGGEGDDELWGAQGDDLLIGEAGADTMIGGVGDDVLIGIELDESTSDDPLAGPLLGQDTDEGDTMLGGFGDDTLIAGNDDVATGDEGDDDFLIGDWIVEGSPATITDFTEGEDVISIGYDETLTETEVSVAPNDAGDAVISFNGQVLAIATGAGDSLTADDIVLVAQDRAPDPEPTPTDPLLLRGTEGADSLSGTGGDETMLGLEGDDVLWGRGGDDVVFAGIGDDVATGALGNDRVYGSDGDDVVSGLWGDDLLRGGAGDDAIVDTRGADTIFGDSGNDTILASGFLDEQALLTTALGAEAGETSLQEAFAATMTAANINYETDEDGQGDLINAGGRDDMVVFGLNDTVTGGAGADTLLGGDWITDENAARITDFDAAEDVLVYSAAEGTTPALSITYSEGATEAEGDAILSNDGVPAIVVQDVGTGFTLENVQVINRA